PFCRPKQSTVVGRVCAWVYEPLMVRQPNLNLHWKIQNNHLTHLARVSHETQLWRCSNRAVPCHLEGRAVCAPKDLNRHVVHSFDCGPSAILSGSPRMTRSFCTRSRHELQLMRNPGWALLR